MNDRFRLKATELIRVVNVLLQRGGRRPLLALVLFTTMISTAQALDAIAVTNGVPALDLTRALEFHRDVGDRLLVSTAPSQDGIVRRIEVRAQRADANPAWAVVALTNTTDRQIDRLLVAPHYRFAGSGLLWPDLGLQRIGLVSPSEGFAPERQPDSESDIFQITLDPGSVVTFVMELNTGDLPQLYLWEPNAFKDSVNAFTLYEGIALGIAGLLCIFLTILFVVKGSGLFPATALLAWSVLIYLTIDFGFWTKFAAIDPTGIRIYRAGTEVVLAGSLLIFLSGYLNLTRWNVRFVHLSMAWLAGIFALVGVAIFAPDIAAGIARIMIALIAVFGLILIIVLSIHQYDRAINLIPTWILFVLWAAASSGAVFGYFSNDLVQPALSGGLVLFVLLISFTVMQHAFAGGALAQGIISDSERRSLALVGAGDIIWDWDVDRDRIYVSSDGEEILGLKRGALEGPAKDWLEVLHPQDQEKFRANLDAVTDQRRGKISQQFRLRAEDGHYHWFWMRARPVVGGDGEVLRCVGTLLDITESKVSEERLLHDSVHDNLTGLPNRELFLDRLQSSITRSMTENASRPAVCLLDIDRFKTVNDEFGLSVGDSLLLNVSRKLIRLLKPQDTLTRIQGDRFGIILHSLQDRNKIEQFADGLRRALRAPVVFGQNEVMLTVSAGINFLDGDTKDAAEMIKNAEIALFHAKKEGGDKTAIYHPALQGNLQSRNVLEQDLQRALERREIVLNYQPIVSLPDGRISGFEALMRWNHPRRGRIMPSDFIPLAEETGLIAQLGSFAMERAARQLADWQAQYPAEPELFVSVNISSSQLMRHNLINEVKAVLARTGVTPGSFKLELTESLVLENPEYAAQILTRIRELGAGLSLDDFGTGYSALSYLQRLPFDTIKIDQSFVRSNRQSQRPIILRSIIGLAHDLNMEVVAEGAETDEDVLELSQLGCAYAQGFLFGQPLPAEEARKLVSRQMGNTRQ